MKIKSLSTSSFGKFESTTQWDDFSDSINVFYGENEAGKSTIFQMIVNLLYGFKITNKDQNLLVNRKTKALNINGEIVVKAGSVFAERQFKSKPTLKILSDKTQYIYDNKALPYSSHITRKTYEDIYALKLSGLTNFKDQTWSEVEDLLLNHYNGDTFRTSKQVMKDIETEMNVIKRKSERGNSLLKSLEEERRNLFKHKREVQDNLLKVEGLKENLLHLDLILEGIRLNKAQLEKKLADFRKYYPIMEIYHEKMTLEDKIDRFESIHFIDENQYLQKKSLLKKLYIEMDDISGKISKLIYEKRKIVDRKESFKINEGELKSIISAHLTCETLREEKKILDNKLVYKEKEFKKEFENAFSEKFNSAHYEVIMNLNYLNIKTLIGEIDELNEEVKILKRNKRHATSGNKNLKIVLMALLALGGGLVNLIDIGPYNTIANNVGFVILGVMSVKIIDTVVRNKSKVLDEVDLFSERDTLRKRLIRELEGIRLSSIVEEFIGIEFLSQINNLKQIAEVFLELKRDYRLKDDRLNDLNTKVVQYIKRYFGTCENIGHTLDEMLETLEANKKMQSNIEIIKGKLDLLNDQLYDVENNLSHVETEVNTVEKLLKETCGDSIENGIGQLKSIKHWKLRFEDLATKLNQYEYIDETLHCFIKAYQEDEDSKDFNESYLITEINILNHKINDHLIEKTSIEKDIESLLDKANLSDVESNLMHIDAVIIEKKKAYDKLSLMYLIIKNSDEVYRQENQPDVFKKAGKYLTLITSGKYENLEIVEVKEKNQVRKEIFVTCKGSTLKVDQSFSSGTLDQIYLSLRLALIDQLDTDHTTLPICFDELLVNWDRKRLENTLRLIKEISKNRQVFIFTCHTWFVDAIKLYSNVKIHNL